MSSGSLERAAQSDAPLSAAVAQRDVGHEIAEERSWRNASLVGRTVTINRPRSEVYAFWRDFSNLARFLQHVEQVEVLDDRRSRWTISAPGKDGSVSWESVLTEDEPDRLLAWESAPDADIRNTGRILFRDAPPGRGTEVTAEIAYEPPGGDIGKMIAKLMQEEPKLQARRDLRRLKQLLETGEISTSEAPHAAPRGG